jgi:hypothetical protein
MPKLEYYKKRQCAGRHEHAVSASPCTCKPRPFQLSGPHVHGHLIRDFDIALSCTFYLDRGGVLN